MTIFSAKALINITWHIKEKEKVAASPGIDAKALPVNEAEQVLAALPERFRPGKTSGHHSIAHDSFTLSLDTHEFAYSQ